MPSPACLSGPLARIRSSLGDNDGCCGACVWLEPCSPPHRATSALPGGAERTSVAECDQSHPRNGLRCYFYTLQAGAVGIHLNPQGWERSLVALRGGGGSRWGPRLASASVSSPDNGRKTPGRGRFLLPACAAQCSRPGWACGERVLLLQRAAASSSLGSLGCALSSGLRVEPRVPHSTLLSLSSCPPPVDSLGGAHSGRQQEVRLSYFVPVHYCVPHESGQTEAPPPPCLVANHVSSRLLPRAQESSRQSCCCCFKVGHWACLFVLNSRSHQRDAIP